MTRSEQRKLRQGYILEHQERAARDIRVFAVEMRSIGLYAPQTIIQDIEATVRSVLARELRRAAVKTSERAKRDIKRLCHLCEQLLAINKDPQPGLMAWNIAAARTVEQIADEAIFVTFGEALCTIATIDALRCREENK